LAVIAIIGVLAALIGAVAGNARMEANQAKCLSNQRQIGIALLLYSNDNHGWLPPTTHTTGRRRAEESWIYEIEPYLASVDKVRVCPADPPARQEAILRSKATSYVLNDLVFDDPNFNRLIALPQPSETMLLFILSENRAPSTTRDHIHGAEWTRWPNALNDIEPDRHRRGDRAPDRLKGSANYLYADGSVRNLTARQFKSLFDQGINPARPAPKS
jgi:prepilin-type processing-associated H-X9-DG protein